MTFEEVQSQWQSQPAPSVSLDAAGLLLQVQTKQQKFRTSIFWRDLCEIGIALAMAVVTLPVGLWRREWGLLLMGACVAFIGLFMLVDRWGQRNKRPATESTLRDCAESSLAEIEHQIWLLRNIFWWYLLPCLIGGLGVILPAALRDWNALPAARHIMSSITVGVLMFCGAILWFGYRINQQAVRESLEPRRQELVAILTDLDEPKT